MSTPMEELAWDLSVSLDLESVLGAAKFGTAIMEATRELAVECCDYYAKDRSETSMARWAADCSAQDIKNLDAESVIRRAREKLKEKA